MPTKMRVSMWLSGGVFLIAVAVWFYQLKEGLILTNMQNSFSWGLYISGLAFFVGNAAGGLVLTSSIYLFGVKKLKPLAKLGALTAFANVTAAMLIVLPDIGKPLRLYNLILHPNFMSPLVWDVIVLNLYALASAIYLYILMLPELTGRLGWLAIKVDNVQEFSETLGQTNGAGGPALCHRHPCGHGLDLFHPGGSRLVVFTGHGPGLRVGRHRRRHHRRPAGRGPGLRHRREVSGGLPDPRPDRLHVDLCPPFPDDERPGHPRLVRQCRDRADHRRSPGAIMPGPISSRWRLR